MAGDLCVRFHQAVELIGRRWSGAVIQLLMQHRLRYAELRAAIPDISDRMLSERLRELEAAGIVVRTVLPDPPVRVEYDLTEKGRALKPALMAIGEWAERWVTAGVPLPAITTPDASAKGAARAPGTTRAAIYAPLTAARAAAAATASRTSPAATRTAPAAARTSAASGAAAVASSDRLRKRRTTTSSR
jgi:DNA-binding HxlR family transcriptional regulator